MMIVHATQLIQDHDPDSELVLDQFVAKLSFVNDVIDDAITLGAYHNLLDPD